VGSAKRWLRPAIWLAAGLALGSAVALWRKAPSPALDAGRIQRVTFDPGRSYMPTLSRDGKLLAYASDRAGQGNLDIWVQQTAGGMPIRLTDDPGDDDMPDISPDGSQISFHSTRAGEGVYVVPTLGGTARLVAQGGRQPRFSPDGSRISYWTGNYRGSLSVLGAATYVVPLAGGAPVRVAPGFATARNAVWSPDGGALLLVGRDKSTGPLTATFDWWWAPVDGRAPVRTGAFDQRDLRSAADAERVFLGAWTESGVLYTEDGTIWLQPMSPTSGRLTGPARLLASGAGVYSDPSMSRDGQIVFAMPATERVIERLPLNSPAPAIRLYADGQEHNFRASQTSDGNTIVFERASGTQREIWQKNIRSGEQQIIQAVKSDSQVNATVSQDGSRIAFAVSRAGYVVETSGGVPKPVCDQCSLYGFLSDNRRVLAVDAGHPRIRLFDVIAGTGQDVVATSKGRVDRPSPSPNDRWIAFRAFSGEAGKTFVAPLTPGRPATPDSAAQIDEPTTSGRPCGWSPDSSVLYLLLDTDGSRDLWGQRIDTASGRPAGKPYLVRHLHGSSVLGIGTSYGNAISPAGFLYEANAVTGNIWRLTANPASR
jgi:Tol biopolymer transport system component